MTEIMAKYEIKLPLADDQAYTRCITALVACRETNDIETFEALSDAITDYEESHFDMTADRVRMERKEWN